MTKTTRIHQLIDIVINYNFRKNLAWEKSESRANEGYVVVFDLKAMVGEVSAPQKRLVEGKEILVFNGIEK
ncbi:MAG: hypothetical protein HF982_10895 [Desulfobacteraceae bacterium]|nr:hypothetical protein [Desulfobacteraceae bacterium]MBC2720073.1 hypothetical protein [Desulfobacteraceae bacterium]